MTLQLRNLCHKVLICDRVAPDQTSKQSNLQLRGASFKGSVNEFSRIAKASIEIIKSAIARV